MMITNNPLVSVIIPIYNVQDYLAECLESVIHQTYTHLEIILINDGSSDASGEIARDFAKRDSRIIYFEQENKGQSVARNIGLDNANGAYICFMDSDDWIDKEYINELVTHLDKSDITLNFNVIFEFGNDSRRFNRTNTLKGTHLLNKKNICRLDFFVCNAIFYKSIIDTYRLRFLENKICEDALFLFQYIIFTPTLSCIDSSAYHYRQWLDSTTGRLAQKEEVSFDRLEAFKRIAQWYQKFDVVEKYGLPFQVLTEIYPFHKNAQEFFLQAKALIHTLQISKSTINNNAIMNAFMCSKDVNEFFEKRDRLKLPFLKRYFRIRLFKEQNLIRLFGITLWETSKSNRGGQIKKDCVDLHLNTQEHFHI